MYKYDLFNDLSIECFSCRDDLIVMENVTTGYHYDDFKMKTCMFES